MFNGSPLFTGDAGSGESEIRRWIIENDWLEAIVALPEQLFYNTGISTYIWILSNRKEPQRKGKIQLIDARNLWVPMEKSLGNKRRRIGDPSDKAKDPDHIGEITRIYATNTDGETRRFTLDGKEKVLVVSKVFDNEDFGYHKITVERPLRLNFQASAERIARLEEQTAFVNLAGSSKKNEIVRQTGNRSRPRPPATNPRFVGRVGRRGEKSFAPTLYLNRAAFLQALRATEQAMNIRLSATELKAVCASLGERDENAEICTDKQGKPESDADLRDTETVPLKESIEAYFQREVLPHIPDAWIDHSKTKIGYEIPLNRHFYRYEPTRELEEIEAEIKTLEGEILDLLKEVTA